MVGYFRKPIKLTLFIVLLLTILQCSNKTGSELPKDILGVSVGMSRDDAERQLRQIGKFSREEAGRQQLWLVREDGHFGSVAVGYDNENRVRYVAGIAKAKGGEPMRFSQVGDVKSAKAEIVEPSHKYVWEVPEKNGSPAHTIIAQGGSAEYLAMLTFVNSASKNEENEEEEEERREREERK